MLGKKSGNPIDLLDKFFMKKYIASTIPKLVGQK
jgi:hypothetical protein